MKKGCMQWFSSVLAVVLAFLFSGCADATKPKIISVTLQPAAYKTQYVVGEALDITNLVLEAVYDNGTKTEIAVTEGMVKGFDSSSAAASQRLTITYAGMTTSYAVSIRAPEAPKVVSIAVQSSTHKTQYEVGEALDITNLVLEAVYDNGTKTEIAVTEGMVKGFDSSSAAASQRLAITYAGITTSYTISIIASEMLEVVSIAIRSVSHKTQYEVGEALEVRNLVIEAVFDNGTKREISVKQDMVTGFNSSNSRISQNLTISYGGKTTAYTVAIYKPDESRVLSISLQSTFPHKTQYKVGEPLDVSGLLIKAHKDKYFDIVVNINKGIVTGFDSSVPAASQTLTVSYAGKTTTFTISIVAEVVSIANMSDIQYGIG